MDDLSRRYRSLVKTLTLAALVMLAIASCGGGDSSGGDEPEASPTEVDPNRFVLEFNDGDETLLAVDVLKPPGWERSRYGLMTSADGGDWVDIDLWSVPASIEEGIAVFESDWADSGVDVFAEGRVVEERVIDGVPFEIHWVGEPSTADRAVAFGHDGTISVAVEVHAAPDRVAELIDSIEVRSLAVAEQ